MRRLAGIAINPIGGIGFLYRAGRHSYFVPCARAFALRGDVSAMGFLTALWLSGVCLGILRLDMAVRCQRARNAQQCEYRYGPQNGIIRFHCRRSPYVAQRQCNAPRVVRAPLFGKYLVNRKILVAGRFTHSLEKVVSFDHIASPGDILPPR